MASENTVQNFIHNLEHGSLQNFIKSAMIGGLILFLFILYFAFHFRGFGNEHAMDQAQIARSIASGHGFSTKVIRPMALWKLSDAEKPVPTENFPDFYNAPLNPFVNAIPLLLIKSKWEMSPKDPIYIGDRVIALVCILFFLASVGVGFFVARHLFDTELALLGCACVLVTDLLWEFSLSGLPQMLMLFLFMLTCWFIICAQQAATEDKTPTLILYLILAALTLGLLTLAHGLGFWLFLGYLIFTGLYFRPRGLAIGLSLLVYALTVSPWLIYNYQVCGNPLGIGCYIGLSVGHSGEALMRSLSPHVNDWMVTIKAKIRLGFLSQIGNLFGNLGLNFAALGFFFALLHPFKRTETAQFRWCILLMWFFAIIGMATFASGADTALDADQLNVLFIPIMVFYGLAFILVLWHRLEISGSIYRLIFLIFIPLLCAGPMLLRLVGGAQSSVNWPPYVPPYIAILAQWTTPDEIIASDVPWAVAWYAQRKSLL
ncbi:MAG: glycosyltransferase family 39 protein, partial [Chthoniobacterales bacterium]